MRDRWTLGVGLTFLALALATLLLWIPRDIESGIVEVFRRSRTIGDAFAPFVAASGVVLCSFALIMVAIFNPQSECDISGPGRLSSENLRYAIALALILAISIALMYWLGPFAAKLAGAFGLESASYRELRATAPWKYIGYLAGGTALVFGLLSMIETKFRWRTAIIAFLIALLIGLAYDLPFDNLLLPPNGDY